MIFVDRHHTPLAPIDIIVVHPEIRKRFIASPVDKGQTIKCTAVTHSKCIGEEVRRIAHFRAALRLRTPRAAVHIIDFIAIGLYIQCALRIGEINGFIAAVY